MDSTARGDGASAILMVGFMRMITSGATRTIMCYHDGHVGASTRPTHDHMAYGGARCSASHAAGQTSARDRSDRCRRIEPAKNLRTSLGQDPVRVAHTGFS